ncbi:MAG: hypothetical protein OXK76_02120 [Gammaproteobacteria bacterium]|nr:hypothetical protein [Gammaproteobacteria bacterium]
MDMKSYILVGGGLLICLVLLHALVSAWRDNRRVSNSDAGEADPDPLDLDAAEDTAVLWTDDPDAELHDQTPPDESPAEASREPTVLMDRSTHHADANADGDVATAPDDLDAAAMESLPADESQEDEEAVEDTVGSLPKEETVEDTVGSLRKEEAVEDTLGSLRRGRRIEIAGKRTEPTVPRAMRPEFHHFVPPTERQELQDEANGAASLDDVIVIWLFAESGRLLDGEALLKAFVSHGLKCDSDRVFKKADPRCGGHWYTVANGVEPGTFDISRPAALETPAVAMLLSLAEVRDPMAAFENMLDVAQDLATTLDAELKDERRSDMSWQTIEHCRQRISDFKRMRLRA